MRLKKLELIGFKSFSDRTVIKFPHGVSSIVGPNGCGKSNIVDALRWVMGEQSAKQLRGKSMDDVIFAGTAGRPPLNMAEVSLTLSNESGAGPEEFRHFTELMITRRVYRSGERHYFINRQPCRLKDIHNIFVGSGMGTRSYSVIQQGNIGAITDANAEERRFFLEEAAGVTRFKTSKMEAQRKVKATQRNLDRLSDITSEISRQMASLKRQARKAEQYNNQKRRARILDVLLSLARYEALSEKIDTTDTLLSQLRDTDLTHTTELKQLDAAVEKIKLDRNLKSQRLGQNKTTRHEAQRLVDRMETERDHLKGDIGTLDTEIANLTQARTDVTAKNDQIIREIEEVDQEHTGLLDTNTALKDALAEERRTTESKRAEHDQLATQLEQNKSGLMDLVAQEARLKNSLQNTSQNRDSIERRLTRINEDDFRTRQTLEAQTRESATATETLEDLRQRIGKANERVTAATEALKAKHLALSEQVKATQSVELERSQRKSQHGALKKMDDNFEWYKGGVKAVMTAVTADPPRCDADVVGLLADVISPDPSYETAVEAVLGESLQYILVANQADGRSAIEYLRDQNAGRGGFIPVGGSTADATQEPTPPPGAECLMDHVTVPEAHRPLVETLLNRVWVVPALETALAMADQQPGATIVTHDGDVVTGDGLLIGGSPENLAGILAKKNEINDLSAQIEALAKRLDEERARQSALEAEVRQRESDLQQASENRQHLIADEIDAEKALYKATEAVTHTRRQLEVIELEKEQLTGEADDMDAEMNRSQKAVATIAEQVSAAQQAVTRTAADLEASAEALEKVNQGMVDLKVKLSSNDASLESNRTTLRRLRSFHEESLDRVEQMAKDIQVKTDRCRASKNRIEAIETELEAHYKRILELDGQIEAEESECQAIDNQINQNAQAITELQTQREAAVQKIRLLELDLTQQQMKRENVVNRLMERYHQPIDALRTEFDADPDIQELRSKLTAEQLQTELERVEKRLAAIADVNLGAIREYEQLKDRYDFLIEQRQDLEQAMADLEKVIRKINRITLERFMKTFEAVNEKLGDVFPKLFEGGSARLELTDPSNLLTSGVEFMISPPGKKLTRMSLLSGGEKALSAISFIFSIFLLRPTSFCILDEIDAPLDDANVFRFNDLLKIIGEQSQIIMITHNKHSMEFADTLFGVTMEKKGVSKLVSVNLERASTEPTQDAA